MNNRMRPVQLILAFAVICSLSLASVTAQEPAAGVGDPAGQAPAQEPMDGLGDFGELDGFLDDGGASELTLSGQLKIEKGSRKGILEVRAELLPPWHVYALDQKGGPGPTKIVVNSPDAIQVTGPFRADREPEVREVEYFETPLREHYKKVVWSAPIQLVAGVDPEDVQLDVQFEGQICSDSEGCKPMFGEPIPVTFGGYLESEPVADAVPDEDLPAEQPGEQPGEQRAARRASTDRQRVSRGEIVRHDSRASPARFRGAGWRVATDADGPI